MAFERRRREIVSLQTFVAEKGLPSSKLGEAPKNVEKRGCRKFRKLFEGSRNADAFCPGGCDVPSPQRKVYVTCLLKYRDNRNAASCKIRRLFLVSLESVRELRTCRLDKEPCQKVKFSVTPIPGPDKTLLFIWSV